MLSSSRTIYPLFRANRIGPYTRFINSSHAVRQEQSHPRILSATRYKDLAALHSPPYMCSDTTILEETEIRLRDIAMYEKIKGKRRKTPQRGNSPKAHDIEVKQKGEKSSSEVKRKASESSWALKQKAENAAFDQAIETDRLDECYRLRCRWWTSSGPDRKKEHIFHRELWGE